MRNFGTVDIRFWLTKRIKRWTDLERYFALYLLTSPHCNLIGCFYAPVEYLAGNLGWDEETIRHHLALLQKRCFLTHCKKCDWVFIRSYLKYNPIDNPNQGKAAYKILFTMPRHYLCKIEILEALAGFRDKLPTQFSTLYPAKKTEAKPADSDSSVPTPNSVAPVLPPAKPTSTSSKTSNHFNEFWSLQFRKEKKAKTIDVWDELGLNTDVDLADQVIQCWIEQKQYRQQYQDKLKTPLPHNWLSNKQWEDEYVRSDESLYRGSPPASKPAIAAYNTSAAEKWANPQAKEKIINE